MLLPDPNSISLVVTDTSRSSKPQMILTGDLLFVGDVGRPDLPGAEKNRIEQGSITL
jgi:hydroxyacylglutathione hydrolase